MDGDLKLYTISSDNAQFHPAMFKAKTLAPGEKTTIQVIFLPRAIGSVDGTLVIQTSSGGYLYQIHGQGIENPYRLHAFVGATVPVGVLYNPAIRIHNPSQSTLHVKEVFTTEGFLHLSLPEGTQDEDDENDFDDVSKINEKHFEIATSEARRSGRSCRRGTIVQADETYSTARRAGRPGTTARTCTPKKLL
mgnify:CR=1 FL=1